MKLNNKIELLTKENQPGFEGQTYSDTSTNITSFCNNTINIKKLVDSIKIYH